MAVLVETNRQGDLVHQALRTCGMHSVLHQPASVFDTPEALEILALLRALSESRGQTAIAKNDIIFVDDYVPVFSLINLYKTKLYRHGMRDSNLSWWDMRDSG